MSLEQPTPLLSSIEAFAPPSSPPAQMDPTSTATSPTHTNTTSSSTSAPEIRSSQFLPISSVAPSPSLDTALAQSSRCASSEALLSPLDTSVSMQTDGDSQIIEALRSKDRLYVLKLGEQMESLINEQLRARIDLIPATSYQRMLVHKCSSYYKLAPETDPATKTIYVYLRSDSRIPAQRICELVPAEESAQPAIKIMRRTAQDRPRIRHNSQPGSVTGDDADLSDIEPSETGSIGGRSNATGGSRKFPTIEEREAAYNEARSRIFGFEEKEKEKEKDMSANSSTFSLSGSGSTSGGRSSMGDADDSASSAATESEWSGPRDKRDGRRGGSVTSSSRSLRTSDHVYGAPNGSGSSRNSRATSPTFTYPSLAPTAPSYEPPYGSQEHPPHGYIQYYLPYPPPPPPHGQISGQPYMPTYPYYPHFPYPQPPPSQGPPHPSNHPTSPPGSEQTYPTQPTPPHAASFANPYPWVQSPPPGHPPYQLQTPSTTIQTNPQGPPPPLQHPNPSHPPYFMPPAPYPPYPMSGFYPPPFPPGQPMHSPPPQGAPQFFPPEMMHSRDGSSTSLPNGNGHGIEGSNHSRASSRNSNSHTGTNGVGRRGASRTRASWNYGPGVATTPHSFNNMNLNDTVGPRLSNRRTSSGSGSNGNKTPGDEASSTASSSTTSSSSRRTFTSTSSKHPLPARPDWAVGIKALPGLHPPRPHEHSNPHSRNMSPARMGGQPLLNSQHGNQNHQPSFLQSTDFPPLSSSAASPEKRPPPPSVGGAWNNASTMRSIMLPGPQGSNTAVAPGNALVHYPNSNVGMQGHSRLDEQDRAFERPPPRNPELFNPKGVVRKGNPSTAAVNRTTQVVAPTNSSSFEKEKVLLGAGTGMEEGNVRVVADGGGPCAVLVDKLAGISLGRGVDGVVANVPVPVVEPSGSGAAVVGASS